MNCRFPLAAMNEETSQDFDLTCNAGVTCWKKLSREKP